MTTEADTGHIGSVELSDRLRNIVAAANAILEAQGPAAITMRRDIVGDVEAFAAAPLVRAVGGDPHRARALLGLAHGLVASS